MHQEEEGLVYNFILLTVKCLKIELVGFVNDESQYTSCHFDMFTLIWYIHEQTLDILSLMHWNRVLKSLKYCFS